MNPLRKPWQEKRSVFTWLGPDYHMGSQCYLPPDTSEHAPPNAWKGWSV